jgi:hypothetical protein
MSTTKTTTKIMETEQMTHAMQMFALARRQKTRIEPAITKS